MEVQNHQLVSLRLEKRHCPHAGHIYRGRIYTLVCAVKSFGALTCSVSKECDSVLYCD